MKRSLLSKSLFQVVALISLAAPLQAQLSGTDNFNDNSRDASKWGTDAVSGGATLVEANGRLEYRVGTPDTVNDFDEAKHPWVLNTARNSDAFDVLLDVFNNVTPSGLDNASIGITVTSLENADDSIYVELYRSGPAADGSGFLSALHTSVLNTEGDHEVLPRTTPSPHSAVTTGSVRLNYNPTAKLFTAYYDPDGSSNGYQWQEYGSFGVGAAGGGSKRNGLWQLSNNLGFQVSVSGFSERLTVASGSVYADNFSAAAASSVSVLGLTKTRNYDQTAAGTTSLYDFSMSAFIGGTQLSSSFPSASNRFQPSGGSTTALAFQSSYGSWWYQDYYATQAELDAAFPNTTYSFLVGASPAISLSFGADSYPVVPVVTASAGTWNGGTLFISPTQVAAGFTLTSNVSNGNGFLTMDVSSPSQTILSNVITTNTGLPIVVNVPPGSLAVGESYDVITEFDQVINSTSVSSQTWAAPEAKGNTINSSNTIFVMQVLTEAEAWRLQHFSIITNTGNAADTATPMNDGITNLLKYATGMNPTQSGRMPGSVTKSGSNILFTYPRSKTALSSGVTYTVEWSDTLAGNSWSSTGVSESAVDQGSTDQVTATMPAGSNGRRFVHLKITPAP